MEVLRASGLSKIYGIEGNRVDAIKSIDLTIRRGEFVAIMGPSGSGKSTLLHMLAGVKEPTDGKVYIDGVDIYSLSEEERTIFRRRQIGVVYQFYNLVSSLNVEENMVLPLLLDGRDVNDNRVDEMLEILSLTQRRKFMPEALSGGQQQRVAIGRALINMPAILFADEPTGNLDSKNSQAVIELLKKSNSKYRQTTILITHDEDIALQASRVIMLEDGVIVRDEQQI